MAQVKWSDLSTGDLIVCPRDGMAERVIGRELYASGRVRVVTTRHGHTRPATDTVEVAR